MVTARPTLLAQLALGAALLAGQPAHAQSIHKCMLAGHMVYQSSPCKDEARPAAAPPHVALAAESPAAAKKKKTLADLLRERDGNAPAQKAAREWQGDGANVLPSRMGAL